jgi:hypothetical protein
MPRRGSVCAEQAGQGISARTGKRYAVIDARAALPNLDAVAEAIRFDTGKPQVKCRLQSHPHLRGW